MSNFKIATFNVENLSDEGDNATLWPARVSALKPMLKRRLAGWVKGIIKEALENVSQRRGSALVYVNAAYTSQMDSRYSVLLGQRKGKKFYCFDGVVLGAEVNAARNILARKDDLEIRLWTPYEKVKSILLERTEQFKSGWDCSSKTLVAMGQLLFLLFPLSTESELPLDKFE